MRTFDEACRTVARALETTGIVDCDIEGATRALVARFGTCDLHMAVYGTGDLTAPVAAEDEAVVRGREVVFWSLVDDHRIPQRA